MLDTQTIEKLAKLARIELTEGEKEKYPKEIESILEYINQIKEVSGTEEINHEKPVGLVARKAGEHRNVMRLDEVLHDTGSFTDPIVADMPKQKDNYLEVKKII